MSITKEKLIYSDLNYNGYLNNWVKTNRELLNQGMDKTYGYFDLGQRSKYQFKWIRDNIERKGVRINNKEKKVLLDYLKKQRYYIKGNNAKLMKINPRINPREAYYKKYSYNSGYLTTGKQNPRSINSLNKLLRKVRKINPILKRLK